LNVGEVLLLNTPPAWVASRLERSAGRSTAAACSRSSRAASCVSLSLPPAVLAAAVAVAGGGEAAEEAVAVAEVVEVASPSWPMMRPRDMREWSSASPGTYGLRDSARHVIKAILTVVY